MAGEFICSAGPDHRNNCETECQECSFLKADRRQQVQKMDWSFGDRRTMSNLMPAGYGASSPSVVSSTQGFSNTFIFSIIMRLLSFNLFDCLLTARALSLGFMEGNPLMADLFNLSMPLGMAAKVAVVTAGAMMLWRFRHVALAVRGMMIVTGCYGAVVLYHLTFQLSM